MDCWGVLVWFESGESSDPEVRWMIQGAWNALMGRIVRFETRERRDRGL